MQRTIIEALCIAAGVSTATVLARSRIPHLKNPPAPVIKTKFDRLYDIKNELEIDGNYKSHADRLRRCLVPSKDFPPNSLDLLTGKIMTYPVYLDGNKDHVVDLVSLCKWWKEDTHQLYINPYTHQVFENIAIDYDKKRELDAFVEQHCQLNILELPCSQLRVEERPDERPKP